MAEEFGEEARVLYVPPETVGLKELQLALTITCHVSPDAGWSTLRAFLSRVKRRLTIGMYDFTAPHILQALRAAVADADATLKLVLDPKVSLPSAGDTESNKADYITETEVRDRLKSALGNRFQFNWAAITQAGKATASIFANAYHIKVAVADGREFWLSSGNWQSSNQPELDPLGVDKDRDDILGRYNREWHVVVESRALAAVFEGFIDWDFDQATPFQETDNPENAVEQPDLLVPEEALERSALKTEYFPPLKLRFTRAKPLRVQPLLTPDNYADHVLPFLQSAQRTLYFQNQYINIGKHPPARFMELVNTLREKRAAGLDVRIILRDLPGARAVLETLVAQGFDPDGIKFQPGSHTKGIIVDGESVCLGSHNWSASGTLENRDASLILYDSRIAAYYQKIFLYDWDNLARQKLIAEESFKIGSGMPQVATGDEADVPSMVRLPWRAVYED